MEPKLRGVDPRKFIPVRVMTTGAILLSVVAGAASSDSIVHPGLKSPEVGVTTPLNPEQPENKKVPNVLRDAVFSFTWQDAQNPEKLKTFIDTLAEGYMKSTKSPRVTKEQLIANTTLYSTTQEFLAALRTAGINITLPENEWGYTSFATGKVFINEQSLKLQTPDTPGLGMIDALWNQWGNVDITPRTQGVMINNPNVGFPSPVSGLIEPFQYYRGGNIYTQTYYGFLRFNAVWNETINVRRMRKELGFNADEAVIAAGNYYTNGIDVLHDLTVDLIPLDEMYEMYATSDIEAFAVKLGAVLPGTNSPLSKGTALFTAIHRSDPEALKQTGVFEAIVAAQKKKT